MLTQVNASNSPSPEPEKVLVVGASMGGLDPFKQLLAEINPAWPMAVFFVQHIHPDHKSQLADLLAKHTDLRIRQISSSEKIEAGCLYLPYPDRHLVIYDHHVHSVNSPKENGSRPSINTLFRSAAVHYRERTAGILLSGLLNDGTMGMKAIMECGGFTIAQHPEEASTPEMPLSAIKAGYVMHNTEIKNVCRILKGFMEGTISTLEQPVPEILKLQVEAVTGYIAQQNGQEGMVSIPMRSANRESDSLVTILTLMQERTNMLFNMAEKEKLKGHERLAIRYHEKAQESQVHTENLRSYIGKIIKDKRSA